MDNFKFSTLEYKRPDFAAFAALAEETKKRIESADSYGQVRDAMLAYDEKGKLFNTDTTIAFIRHTLDTTDEFYDKENEYINNTFPTIMPQMLAVDEALMNSPFRADYEKEFGRQCFAQKELEKKSFCEENIPLMQQEAKLTNEYQKIMATAEISFDGKTLNLYGVQKYFEHEDREVRKGAARAYSEFYHKHEKRLEEIWDELIRIRNEMGRNLGYENYIPVGYMKQGRIDYGQKEVASFREQVRTVIVPICQKLYEAQAKRLGVDDFSVFDEKRIFPDGNAVPAGDDDFMVGEAAKMYHEMSPETGEFIDFMIGHELMDLKNKAGKASTGYMTELQKYSAPFVFSCFNQTIGDMQVLTHELGHAFAGYMAMRCQPFLIIIPYRPTLRRFIPCRWSSLRIPMRSGFSGSRQTNSVLRTCRRQLHSCLLAWQLTSSSISAMQIRSLLRRSGHWSGKSSKKSICHGAYMNRTISLTAAASGTINCTYSSTQCIISIIHSQPWARWSSRKKKRKTMTWHGRII